MLNNFKNSKRVSSSKFTPTQHYSFDMVELRTSTNDFHSILIYANEWSHTHSFKYIALSFPQKTFFKQLKFLYLALLWVVFFYVVGEQNSYSPQSRGVLTYMDQSQAPLLTDP